MRLGLVVSVVGALGAIARGKYDEDPGTKGSDKRAIDVDLPCVDLST